MTAPAWDILIYAFAGAQKDERAIRDAIQAMRTVGVRAPTRITVQLHTSTGAQRHRFSGEQVEVEPLGFVNASKVSTLRGFLDDTGGGDGGDGGEARATALILYGHGSGLDNVFRKRRLVAARSRGACGDRALTWRCPDGATPRRVGPDPGSGEFLTNRALRDAIAGSTRRKVDVLAFNACSMAMLEIAEELRDVAAIQIGSQVDALIWPYGALAAALAERPRLSAEALGRELVAQVGAQLEGGKRHDTISAFRSASVAQLTLAFQDYATRATGLLCSHREEVYEAVVVEAQRVYDPYQVDLLSLTTRLAARLGELSGAAAKVHEHFTAAHLASTAHPARGDVHGLSLFCPTDTGVVLGPPYADTRFAGSAWAKFLDELHHQLA